MIYKKISAVILAAIIAFSTAACGKEKQPETPEPDTADTSIQAADASVGNSQTQPTEATESTEPSSMPSEQTSSEQSEEATSVNANAPTYSADNPAEWTVGQIVDTYKKAAAKTHSSVKSQHSIDIKTIKVNGDDIPSFVQSIMKTLLKNNETEKDGITGGYTDLTANDVASAKAYKNGSALVIEMTMKKQTSGANEDANSGTVGHAITAVGDISVVTKQLEELKLPLDLNEKETRIYYTDPTVKVMIDPNGKIVNGTWQYTVEVRLNNYKAFGQPVESTSVIMVNTLTVGGGFKKM